MDQSRRRFLQTGGLLSLIGVAGCTQSEVTYPHTADDRVTVKTPSADETNTTDATSSGSPTYPTLAKDTRNILTEINWFATSYSSAIKEFKTRAGRAGDTVSALRRKPKLKQSHMDDLRGRIQYLTQFLDGTLGPHFDATDQIIHKLNDMLSTIEKFSKRGDLDRADAELGSLLLYLSKITYDGQIHKNFTEKPINDRLFRRLVSDNYSVSRPLAFTLSYPDMDYVTTAKIPRFDRSASWSFNPYFPDTDYEKRQQFTELKTIFEGVSVPDKREEHAYIAMHPGYKNAPTRLTYLQQFSDEKAATSALETLWRGRVSQEGTREFGSRKWRRIYYYQDLTAADQDSGYLQYREEDGMVFNSEGGVTREANGLSKIVGGNASKPDLSGDVVYAYLVQSEDCLITIAPSLTAWTERKKKQEDVIQYSWLSSSSKKNS